MQKWFDQLDWQPGVVFDPFMGSGRTAVMAVRLGLHFFGCDVSEKYVVMARQAVAEEWERVEKERANGRQLEMEI